MKNFMKEEIQSLKKKEKILAILGFIILGVLSLIIEIIATFNNIQGTPLVDAVLISGFIFLLLPFIILPFQAVKKINWTYTTSLIFFVLIGLLSITAITYITKSYFPYTII